MSKRLVQPGLVIGDTSYPLACDINALCDVEAAFSLSFPKVVGRFSDGGAVSLTDFRTLLSCVICDAGGARLDQPVAAEVMKLADLGAVAAAVQDYMLAAATALAGKAAVPTDG